MPDRKSKNLSNLELDRPPERVAIRGLVLKRRVPERIAHALAVVGDVDQAQRDSRSLREGRLGKEPPGIGEGLQVEGQNGREAEPLLKELVARKKSEAPRYYYADFLIGQSRRDEATGILNDILRQYRRGTPVWRFQEKRWFYAAKRLLKTQR